MNKEISKETLSVPAIFQKKDEYTINDIRFTKVKIWLMHTGINENGSCFSRECIEKAIPTLANTPILGYLEENRRGEEDFSDHRKEFVTKNGKRKFKYLGSAYGVIPETNNAHFEMRLCDDGIEREFLVVDGLMWNKLEDGVDILSKTGIKGQSMELDDENFDGYFDANKIYHFTNIIFYGACLLGMDAQPAMINSTVEMEFCKNLKDEIRSKLEVFNEYVKGGASVDKEKESTTKEQEDTDVKTDHATKDEDVKKSESEKDGEEVKTDHASENGEKDESNKEKEDESNKEVKTEHATKDEDVKKSESEKDGEEVKTDHASDEKKKDDSDDSKKEKEDESNKEKEDDVKTKYTALEAEYNALKTEFAQVQTENVELKATLKEEREFSEKVLFEKYDADLVGIKEYEDIKKQASEFTSTKELEKEIALVFTQNVKTSFTKESTRAYFENDKSASDSRYGYLAEKYK